MPNIYFYILV